MKKPILSNPEGSNHKESLEHNDILDESFELEDLWVVEAREKVESSLELLEFNESSVTIGVEHPKYDFYPQEFTDYEELRTELILMAEVQLSANAPFEGGEPLVDISGDRLVDEMLEKYGITEDTFHQNQNQEK